MAAPSNDPTARPRLGARLGLLGQKLGLALAVLALVAGLLELAARLLLPSLAPVLVRPGYYKNPLPLVTGTSGPPADLPFLPAGERLPEAKRPGELRVFVMGESSVEGSPLGLEVSPPAMLKDLLDRRLPGRDVTVVNMGRSGSIATTTFYYLVYLRRYAPDYVVFYMGMNDTGRTPGEQCLPGTHPAAHGLWRGLVSHSWLLWLTRVYSPRLFWKATARSDWHPARDCPVDTLPLWTSLLVETATGLGARVVVATPVLSAAELLEPEFAGGEQVQRPIDEAYRGLLACALTEGCDLAARLRSHLQATPLPACDPTAPPDRGACVEPGAPPRSLLETFQADIEGCAAAWEVAARRWGADYLPFHRLLAEASPGGLLASTFFMDKQHLAPTGYYYLAALASERLAALETGEPARPVTPPDDATVQPYLHASPSSGLDVELGQLVRGWFLTAVPGLQVTARSFRGQACATAAACAEGQLARVALAWLRVRAGLEPGLPPELADALATFDPRAVLEALEAAKRGEGPPPAVRGPTPAR